VIDCQALEGELYRFRLEVEGPSVAETLSLQLARSGYALRELRREQTSLEDVFTKLTTHEHAEPEPASQEVA
jgi:hypothetical protein